ncbi:hypothetical protein GCM10010232_52320 [Streptomyces amakusaensis]
MPEIRHPSASGVLASDRRALSDACMMASSTPAARAPPLRATPSPSLLTVSTLTTVIVRIPPQGADVRRR